MTVRLVNLSGQDSRVWLEPALDVYVTAMGYPRGTEVHRAALWREHIARPGWRAIGAIASLPPHEAQAMPTARRRVGTPVGSGPDDVLVGIAYGYTGATGQWWNQQLRLGLRQTGRSPAEIEMIARDYFELTELHVHPTAQGRGIGQLLLARLLADRPERHVLLSTPEIPAEQNRAWSLYRRMGFSDVLRHFTFTGDPRPFAFLGRPLPLELQPPSAGPARPAG
ncbi:MULTISPECIES: GNAT family N-acetyltransferase [Gordonia]|uniref:GNAT family N-acetyltransferase n=1 Tax=Gordonia amicalis TaxID=89053 RepID=A0AAE4R4C7_9ACTN|nr:MULTISPECIES: GNAT family N-acetyltransferase [Gordonia]ATD71416.1 N-acetyltransferase [Gordonia sp. 1D]MCZ4580206.1 GNAT family N-acetyltransferase [Gordonia amicalis]MCZ4650289.1 GNAT family N-acetyltransferase [Gordonia amicalis]MDJ0452230.1 GNAT family N-acetyltransferase [Gordonia amicalis]MDV6313175.1 GNAT family N-acetyltransferase [Gordonia amicalis]